MEFCQHTDKPALLQINAAIIKLLRSGNGNSAGLQDSMVISSEGKQITVSGRPGTIARRLAGLLWGKGIDDLSLNAAIAFTGRQTCAFTRKGEFDKVVRILEQNGYSVEKFPESVKE